MGTQIGDGVVGTRNLEGTQDSDLPNFTRPPRPLPLRVTQNKPWTVLVIQYISKTHCLGTVVSTSEQDPASTLYSYQIAHSAHLFSLIV